MDGAFLSASLDKGIVLVGIPEAKVGCFHPDSVGSFGKTVILRPEKKLHFYLDAFPLSDRVVLDSV